MLRNGLEWIRGDWMLDKWIGEGLKTGKMDRGRLGNGLERVALNLWISES